MSLVLVTGLPGHGKTLHALFRVEEISRKDNRPVFYAGIKLKDHPAVANWTEWDPEKWQDLPPNALFLVDEAQFRFKVQGRTKPDFIENLSVHRHGGVDIWMVTQHPTFLDPFVRRLVDRHYHTMRKMGTRWTTIYEFAQSRDNCEKSAGRKDAVRHEWMFDKRIYDWYHSSEAHTGKLNIPLRLLIFAVLPFVCIGAAYVAYQGLWGENSMQNTVGKKPGSAGGQGGVGGQSGAAGPPQPLTPAEYAARYQPRIPGLPHTAPAFDEVTRPSQAPFPAACLASKTRCQCYSQQATRIDAPDQLCRDIAAGGFFISWNQPVAQAVPVAPQAAGPAPVAVAAPPAQLAPVYLHAQHRGAVEAPQEAEPENRPRVRRPPGQAQPLPPG